MRKDEIEVGKTYRINDYGISKAVVKSGPMKRGYRKVYSFLVEYETREPGQKAEKWVESRGFMREWTDADEENAQHRRDERLKVEQIENALTFAGYPGVKVRSIANRQLMLIFESEEADRVFQTLTNTEPDAFQEQADE